MKMHQKAVYFLAVLGLMFSPISKIGINALAQDSNSISTIQVEVNDNNANEVIKKEVIAHYYPNDLNIIDFEKSEMKVENLDITKVGTQEIHVFIQLKPKTPSDVFLIQNTIQTKLRCTVNDSEKPKLTLKNNLIYIKTNSEFDPTTYIDKIEDNSHEEDLNDLVTITNPVDITTNGSYEVVYTAFDHSNNFDQQLLTVVVTANPQRQGSVSSGEKIDEMLNLINEGRAALNLEPLQLADENGQKAISMRASESIGNITHRRPDGSHYKTALEECNVDYQHSPLEVLTYAGSTVEAKYNWWMSSPNHRAILHSKGYTTIAIGYCSEMWAAIVY